MEQTFEAITRRSLIVYMRNLRQVRNLRRYGNVEYVSRRMRYVVLYMNDDKILTNKDKIEQLGFVLKTQISVRPDLNVNLQADTEDRGFSLEDTETLEVPNEGVEI
ncbi:YlbG family protein [Periweissella fabalis]|uniref:YlbG family protein n=1 Tax=Periweissella fabalis TaxID=1070421 RepID=A0A7X6N3G6_9LACO|nr:YlbG family protein [Periweissella fabalis]MCM0598794.1 YlbG family protein [Periweissella fabalis]NKZ24607.1 YlbG family protein [Periweissella fabalis]